MKNKFAKITAVALSILIVLLAVLTVALPKKDFSENENRYLADFPKLTINSLFSGKFVEDLEAYIQDNFAFRDFFIESKAETELLLGKDQNNGVYVTSDGYFIGAFESASEAEIQKRVDKINNLLSKLQNVNAVFTLVPTSNTVNGDKLPSDRPDDSEEKVIEEINRVIDATNVYLADVLKGANKTVQQYFKTDHHWTSSGAYTAYVALSGALGYTPVSLDEFSKVVVSDFYGTLYSKSGLYSAGGEDFVVYKNNSEVSVSYPATGVETDTMYADKFLSEKDKYSYYFGGNQPLTVITNENAETDRHLLIVKDSYANSLAPYLVENFKTVTLVDMRFFTGRISEYAEQNGVTDLLILYNVDGFMTDTGINKLN